jgi:hypothetical protein
MKNNEEGYYGIEKLTFGRDACRSSDPGKEFPRQAYTGLHRSAFSKDVTPCLWKLNS